MTHIHVQRHNDDADTGYATANVRPLTPEDQATLSVLWHAAFPHGEYGATGCALCRRLEAERVSCLFPDSTIRHTEATSA